MSPLDKVIVALSARLIALAFPTTICALGRRFKTAPVAVAGPVPTVLGNGFGAVASQVVVSPAVVQLANAEVESHPPIRAKRSDATRSRGSRPRNNGARGEEGSSVAPR